MQRSCIFKDTTTSHGCMLLLDGAKRIGSDRIENDGTHRAGSFNGIEADLIDLP